MANEQPKRGTAEIFSVVCRKPELVQEKTCVALECKQVSLWRPLAIIGRTLLACLFLSIPAQAQDAKAGRDKARMCTVCHGDLGIAVAPNAPNLAGENAAYIEEQLKAFKSGRRQHEQMSIIASGLSDKDIKNLAAWFSMIKVEATAPDL